MKKVISLLLAVMLCLSVTLSVAEEPAKTYEFVFIVKSMQFSFMLSMIDGAEKAAALVPNIHIVCEGPETPYSVTEQIELVEQAITNHVDAIMITPADSTGIVPAIEAANAAGIPIATPNTKAYGGNVLTWVGVDNYQVGYQLGYAMMRCLIDHLRSSERRRTDRADRGHLRQLHLHRAC